MREYQAPIPAGDAPKWRLERMPADLNDASARRTVSERVRAEEHTGMQASGAEPPPPPKTTDDPSGVNLFSRV